MNIDVLILFIIKTKEQIMIYLKAEETEQELITHFKRKKVVKYGLGYEKLSRNTYYYTKESEPYALKFTASASQTLKWTGSTRSFEYSYDGENWTSWNGTSSTISFGTQEHPSMYLRGKNSTAFDKISSTAATSSRHFVFSTSAPVTLEGNINSIIDYENENITTLPDTYMFRALFWGQTALYDISGLELPAASLTNCCYMDMFSGCSNIVYGISELPAMTIPVGAYRNMFRMCKKLSTPPPTLPATSLSNCAYTNMFYDCWELPSAVDLPATVVPAWAYASMYRECHAITSAPIMSATSFSNNAMQGTFNGCLNLASVPVDYLPVETLNYEGIYSGLFLGCKKLTSAPNLPATFLGSSSIYYRMYSGCTSLVSGGAIMATSGSGGNHFYEMYAGCTSLNYIKCMWLAQPSTISFSNWANSVPTGGTFVKNASATWSNVYGISAIPEGWTVTTASS